MDNQDKLCPQTMRYYKTLLTVLVLLMSLGAWASGDSEKAVVDMDFKLTDFSVKDYGGVGKLFW